MSSVEAFCSEGCALAKSNRRSSVARRPSAQGIPDVVHQAVLDRDVSCQMCGSKRNLHVHHIYYRSEALIEWRHDEANLIVLCRDDHDLVHSDKGKYQRKLLDKMKKKGYADPHESTTSNSTATEAVAKELDL